MVKYNGDHLDAVFSALGDRSRRTMLARLTERPLTVSELAEPLAMSLPAVSKHVRVLAEAGLIRKQRDGRLQRCSLRPEALRAAEAWIERQRRFWEESFDSLEAYLREVRDAS